MWYLIHLAIDNPFPNVPADHTTITTVLDFIFATFGAIAVLIIVIGGFRYILSGGNPQQANQARDTIIYAAVGLALVIFAYTIVSFVLEKL